ncbi:MAG: tetratricopeptide repeat protein [Chitinophagales bacterium]
MGKNKQTQKAKQPQAKPQLEQKKSVPQPLAATKTLADKWLILILVGVALAANIATIGYDYTLDDPYFTTGHPYVRQGLSQTSEFFTHAAYYGVYKNHDASYRPLLLLSFAAEHDLFGFNPKVSHTLNLLIFASLVTALFLLLRRVLNTFSVYIPFFIVLLFAVHPIHTEVVASVKSRDELMGFLFAALCTLQSIKYIDTGKMKYLILSGIYFFLALLSKETPITFVAIVPMTIYFFRNIKAKQLITTMAPYVAVTVVYMLMRAGFIETGGEKVRILVNNNALMAAGSYGEKLATALFIQLKYILLLIFPHPLSYDYSYNQIPIISFSNVKALAALLVGGGLLVYAFMGVKQKNIYAYCILFYLGSAALTSNIFVDIGATMAERFVFTASLGYCMALVFLVAKLLKSDTTILNYVNSSNIFFVLIGISVLYSIKTFARNEAWKNNLTLYETGAETAPNSWRAQYLLGVEYAKMINGEKTPEAKKEMFNKAMVHLNTSNAILPGIDVNLFKGLTFDMMGNDDSALASYKTVISVDPDNQKACTGLGGVYLRKNNFPEAISILSKVVVKDSTYIDALSNLAAAYGNSGHYRDAIGYYLRYIRLNPDPPDFVLTSLSNLYRVLGDSANARHYQQLLSNKKKE